MNRFLVHHPWITLLIALAIMDLVTSFGDPSRTIGYQFITGVRHLITAAKGPESEEGRSNLRLILMIAAVLLFFYARSRPQPPPHI